MLIHCTARELGRRRHPALARAARRPRGRPRRGLRRDADRNLPRVEGRGGPRGARAPRAGHERALAARLLGAVRLGRRRGRGGRARGRPRAAGLGRARAAADPVLPRSAGRAGRGRLSGRRARGQAPDRDPRAPRPAARLHPAPAGDRAPRRRAGPAAGERHAAPHVARGALHRGLARRRRAAALRVPRADVRRIARRAQDRPGRSGRAARSGGPGAGGRSRRDPGGRLRRPSSSTKSSPIRSRPTPACLRSGPCPRRAWRFPTSK